MCVQSQIKYQTQEKMNPNELERMFLIAKDFKKIGESALNISEYLMEIVNGNIIYLFYQAIKIFIIRNSWSKRFRNYIMGYIFMQIRRCFSHTS